MLGFEQLETKIEAKVVGLAEMCACEPALILCPADKNFSKKEILNMIHRRRTELKGVYIDNTIP